MELASSNMVASQRARDAEPREGSSGPSGGSARSSPSLCLGQNQLLGVVTVPVGHGSLTSAAVRVKGSTDSLDSDEE